MAEESAENTVPLVADSGSDGQQSQETVLLNKGITTSLVPKRPVENTFDGLIHSEGRSSGSAVLQKLALANMQELNSKCERLETQLDAERDRRIEAEASIGVLEEKISSDSRNKFASTALLILGPLLLSQAVTMSPSGEFSWDVLLTSAGIVSLVAGLVVQHSSFKLKKI